MALKNFLNGGIMNGLLGNMSQVDTNQLTKEYAGYLMDAETVTLGFKLVRDVVLFTDKRILMFDKQGTTGTKMRVVSVNMETIVGVTAETAGFGLDDSEITITFITTPNLKSNNIQMENRKFEFPKSYNIQPLYKMLQEISYENFTSINNIHK